MNNKAQLARWMFRLGLLLIVAGLFGYLVAAVVQPEKTMMRLFLTYLPSFGSGILFGVFLGTAGWLLQGHFDARHRQGISAPKAWETGDTS